MQIKSLELRAYRNYKQKKINFESQLNIIVGLNGHGKSNLIEAIQFLSLARSHKTHTYHDVIQFDESGASLEGQIFDDYHNHVISIQFSKQGKLIKWNGKNLSKSSDLLRIFHSILITSDDHRILTHSPVDRRKYLDSLLSKMNPEYMQALRTLKKINRQKNNLYKQGSQNQNDLLMLYQEELVKQHRVIVEMRKQLLDSLEKKMKRQLKKIFSDNSTFELELRYFDTLPITSSNEVILKKEKQYHESLFGAHRDDFEVFLGGKELKKYNSLGEQQLIALLLKLSEKDYVIEMTGLQPVILIDDAWLGLDDERKGLFKELLKGPQQKIITTTTLKSEVWDLADPHHIIEL